MTLASRTTPAVPDASPAGEGYQPGTCGEWRPGRTTVVLVREPVGV